MDAKQIERASTDDDERMDLSLGSNRSLIILIEAQISVISGRVRKLHRPAPPPTDGTLEA